MAKKKEINKVFFKVVKDPTEIEVTKKAKKKKSTEEIKPVIDKDIITCQLDDFLKDTILEEDIVDNVICEIADRGLLYEGLAYSDTEEGNLQQVDILYIKSIKEEDTKGYKNSYNIRDNIFLCL